MQTEIILKRIGKSTFVKYYYNFKNESFEYCANNFEEQYTTNSKNTKISQSKLIFENKLEKQALQLIINSSKTGEVYKQMARKILKEDFMI